VPPPDELLQLADGFIRGDVHALEGLIRALGPKIAAGLTRRHPRLRAEDIEDVLSIASHRLWASRAQYHPAKGSLAAWFFIIADNAAKDLVKKEARRREQPGDFAQFADWSSVEPPESAASDAATTALSDLLVKLPPVDRCIISAYAAGGGAGAWAADLSRELGMRPGAIRVRCRRIKERLRKKLHARTAPACVNDC
jgi:RNA polymerase sigma factor (sigma-70 family)